VDLEVIVSAENLVKREQSTPEELQRFVELAHMPAAEGSDRTALQSFLVSNPRNLDEAHNYVGWAVSDNVHGKLYGEIYPEATTEERIGIAWADVAAIVRTHYLLWDSCNDPSERMYDGDKPLFDNATFGLVLDENRSRFDLPVRERTLEESPLYRQRVEQGMPRVMQLFVAVQAMHKLSSDKDWRQKHANAFYHLPALWDLSDEETRVVTSLTASTSQYAPHLVSLMAADERLLERYRGENGTIDVERYGGREALLANAQDAFKQFIRWGSRNAAESQEWLDMESNLEVELADVFPHAARKSMAFEEWLEHPQPAQPDEALQRYISLPEAARLSTQYISEDIERFDSGDIQETKISSRPSRRWAARKLECSPEVVDGATYRDYEELFDIIETCDETGSAEVKEFVARYKTAGATLDGELTDLLKDYYYAATDRGLVWPVQGWTGAPEEEEVVRQMSAERHKKFQKIRDLEETIKQKIANN
jgi:hypothetical protein